MKLLIIGSKGFIGSACYSFFQERVDYEVYGVDVMVDYIDPHYFQIDASNANFKDIFRSIGFDFCINCSGAASVPDSLKHPLRDFFLNVSIVILLLEAIRNENPFCKFIQLSSAAVYGNPSVLPVTESMGLNPMSPYGVHKKHAEEVCTYYSDYFNLTTYVVRVFSAYGSGLKKQLFWDLYSKCSNESNVTLFGTGEESRDFINIDDIIHAFCCIIWNASSKHMILNLANGKQIMIKEAVKIFAKEFEYSGKVVFNQQNRTGDPLYWQADITKLKALGYKQHVNFDEGIRKYCEWLKKIK